MKPNYGFEGRSTVGMSGSFGNSEKLITSVSSLNRHQVPPHEVLLMLQHRYGEGQNRKDTHNGSVHLRYGKSWLELPMTEIFTQIQFDEFQRLDRRELLGGGLRWTFRPNEAHQVAFGFGGFYEWERYSTQQRGEQTRINFYLAYLVALENNHELTLTVYHQPHVSRLNDFRTHSDIAWALPIFGQFRIQHQLEARFDNDPIEEVKKYDLNFRLNLALNY